MCLFASASVSLVSMYSMLVFSWVFMMFCVGLLDRSSVGWLFKLKLNKELSLYCVRFGSELSSKLKLNRELSKGLKHNKELSSVGFKHNKELFSVGFKHNKELSSEGFKHNKELSSVCFKFIVGFSSFYDFELGVKLT